MFTSHVPYCIHLIVYTISFSRAWRGLSANSLISETVINRARWSWWRGGLTTTMVTPRYIVQKVTFFLFLSLCCRHKRIILGVTMTCSKAKCTQRERPKERENASNWSLTGCGIRGLLLVNLAREMDRCDFCSCALFHFFFSSGILFLLFLLTCTRGGLADGKTGKKVLGALHKRTQTAVTTQHSTGKNH